MTPGLDVLAVALAGCGLVYADRKDEFGGCAGCLGVLLLLGAGSLAWGMAGLACLGVL